MTAPWTIDRIKALADPIEQIAAVKAYDKQMEAKREEAHLLRDLAILKLLETDGPTAVSRKVEMSVSHVKMVQLLGKRR